jgi:hypothetical protein
MQNVFDHEAAPARPRRDHERDERLGGDANVLAEGRARVARLQAERAAALERTYALLTEASRLCDEATSRRDRIHRERDARRSAG